MATKTTPAAKAAADTASQPAAKTHYATRDFKDAGTTRFFERGAALHDVKPGEMANYVAAGLASTEKPKDPSETEAAALDATRG